MSVQDEVLAAKVQSALAADRRTAGLPIQIRVSNGEVYVKGKVSYREQAEVIQFIIKGIPGVHHVDTRELEVMEGDK
jgi:osmotically-inducible protein OsmY